MSHGRFWHREVPSPSMRLDVCVTLQVAGVRSNLWPGAAAVASGAAFTNVYVGWGVKTGPFLPLPPPPVAQEYDQVGLGPFHVLHMQLCTCCLPLQPLASSTEGNCLPDVLCCHDLQKPLC